jgi:site-specific DNA recombinase
VSESERCAVYARYSNEKQNPLTIEQQTRKCREEADRRGWRVLDAHIYADEAITGATDNREGLRRLLAAARQTPRPFDIVLADDTSRVSRRLADSLRIFEQLQFLGIRMVFVAQGIDTSSEQAELLVGVHGIVDSLYLKDLAKRTFRGVEQRAIDGLHTGGRVFGYRRVPIESATERDSYGRPLIAGVKLAVDPAQAATVRRIFERYAAGDSLKRIAIDLNDEGILSPQPQKGRVSRSWCPSSVRHILHNERYRGKVVWGKTQKVRSAQTGKRIYRRKPPSEWRRREIPEQRIVSEELWAATRRRMQIVEQLYDCGPGKRPCRGRMAGSPYLFTGLLECSVCHGSITIVSGQWRARNDSRYGCSMHAYRGDRVCTNNLLVSRIALEKQLLAGLQTKVLHPDVIEYTFRRFEAELAKLLNGKASEAASLRSRVNEIERQIHNCTEAIASMGLSHFLRAQLTELEAQHEQITEKLLGLEPRAVRLQLRDTRRFVETQLRNLQSMWAGEARLVRAEIAKHVSKIMLIPEGRAYIASGTWDLLGGMAVRMVPGARVARNPRSSHHFSLQIPFQIKLAA